MAAIKLSIGVWTDQADALRRGGWAAGGPVRLFTRTVHWPFLPREDDTIHVMQNAIEDEWYGEVDIYRIFFSPDEVHIELTGLVVDPPPEIEAYWTGQRRRIRKLWWSDRDGDPIEQLLASGWEEYR